MEPRRRGGYRLRRGRIYHASVDCSSPGYGDYGVRLSDGSIAGDGVELEVVPGQTVDSVRAPCPGKPCRFALAAGGGIDNWGDLTLVRTRVSDNQAGGPFNSTQVLTTYAFQTGINAGNIGEGAAVALFMLPLLAAVTIGMLFFARRAEVT